MAFTIGIDFGTNSVRAVVVRCEDGREIGVGVSAYPSGEQGILLDPRDHHLARQHPGDYLGCLTECVCEALAAAARNRDFAPQRVIGIGVDTTGSSPLPVDRTNRALGMLPKWRRNLNAQCWLWKDHTAWREAERITVAAASARPEFLARCGGHYSSEWFWSKIWRCLAVDREVFREAYSWVELCDWIPAVLCGVNDPHAVRRSVCAAGHKAMYATEWGGLPDKEFLAGLDRRLAGLRRRLFEEVWEPGTLAGVLSATWARKLGVSAGIAVATGQFDVHLGAVGCGVTEGTLVKVIGTSTCDCAVLPRRGRIRPIPGICGIVDSSILPGLLGVEAGQSAVGDIFKWWVSRVCGGGATDYAEFEREAVKLPAGASGLLALDWNNGNRTVLADPLLTGLLIGTTLHTTRAEIYRALIEATAFGARVIIERLEEGGVRVERVVCAGGIAEKSPMLMQIYADVLGREMHVTSSQQACALGSAISAAVATGAYADFSTAQKAMTSWKNFSYQPDPVAGKTYDRLYTIYRQLHDSFGGVRRSTDLSRLMKSLLEIKASATP